jgi:hypothetical protein
MQVMQVMHATVVGFPPFGILVGMSGRHAAAELSRCSL